MIPAISILILVLPMSSICSRPMVKSALNSTLSIRTAEEEELNLLVLDSSPTTGPATRAAGRLLNDHAGVHANKRRTISQAQRETMRRRGQFMTILMWSAVNWWPEPPTIIDTHLGMCELTTGHSLIRSADVVLFHSSSHIHSFGDPRRPRGALWVYFSMESPYADTVHGLVSTPDDRVLHNVNALFTYETFANISSGYGRAVPYKGHAHESAHRAQHAEPSALFARPKLAVALISNCAAYSLRNRRIEELRVLLGRDMIDIMGANATCANAQFIWQCSAARDFQAQLHCCHALGRTYKFYVAIENSDCLDYITEKVWVDSFYSGMVPIVWGTHTNYSAHLPPKSYINCADFASPSECAAHIRAVASDEALYSSYHAWRDKYWSDNMFYTDQWVQPKALCEYALRNGHQEKANIDVKSLRNDRRLCAYPDSS